MVRNKNKLMPQHTRLKTNTTNYLLKTILRMTYTSLDKILFLNMFKQSHDHERKHRYFYDIQHPALPRKNIIRAMVFVDLTVSPLSTETPH